MLCLTCKYAIFEHVKVWPGYTKSYFDSCSMDMQDAKVKDDPETGQIKTCSKYEHYEYYKRRAADVKT